MEKMLNIKINGRECQVPYGTKIIEAARMQGIEIPTLCYLKDMNEIGACRFCVVEVVGARSLVTACVYPIEREGTEILTNSDKVRHARKMTLELILSTHDKKCLSCVRSGDCELQKYCKEYGIDDLDRFQGSTPTYEIDYSAAHMVRDNNKCILCRRCVAACNNQGISVIGANARGIDTHIGSPFELPLNSTSCISCGQCIVSCPTGALYEKDSTAPVFEAINDPTKHVVVQVAPAVRSAIAECFGNPIGTDGTGKMFAAMRRLGFDKVFDTNFGADLTIMEEATELLDRVQNGGVLPMITSCSPGWIRYCEHYYPEQIPHLSTCKSPQQMQGAAIKTYYAQLNHIDPKDIVSVSVMPCTAKKFECGRADQSASGYADVDYVLTTRELARMINTAGLNFNLLPEEDCDSPLGQGTGAAVIFGVTGGVMEAALRTAAETITGTALESVDFTEVRGLQGVKEASYKLGDLEVKVAIASGTKNAKILMDKVKAGTADYHFIEIMACPGGCINGGGQPIQPATVKNFVDIRALRASVLYNRDANRPLRKSHESPDIIKAYKEYFGEPGSHKAHKALHTSYVPSSIKTKV